MVTDYFSLVNALLLLILGLVIKIERSLTKMKADLRDCPHIKEELK